MKNNTFRKAITIVGFIALGIGVISAYREPATGFELSTYTATPLVFWLCSCFAVFASVFVVFSQPDKETLRAAGFLGGFSMTTIVALPLVRGYHYLGREDSLSHLGGAKSINEGAILMTENRYPVVHTLGSVLHDATGLPLTHVMLLLVVLFIVAFFLFVPLAIRQLTGNTVMSYIGLFSGLLLLPLNHLSPSTFIHPTSQALMYAPAFLFIFFVLYRHRTWRLSALFLVTAPAFVLLHPQQAANLILFFGTIAVLQVGSHLYRGHGLGRYREWILPEVAVYGVAFWLWVRNLDIFWGSIEAVLMVPFADTKIAESTVSRSFSLTAVGGSLPEVFMKLFFVSLLFALLTTLLAAYELLYSKMDHRLHSSNETVTPDGGRFRPNLRYVFYGLVPVGAVFVVYLVGGISDQYFRHLGMLMVFASILGSIALGRIFRYVTVRYTVPTGSRIVGGFLLFCLVLTIPVVFPSPYIYDSPVHVTEQQMDGYETTFEHQSETIRFDDVRSTTSRYGNAIEGWNVSEDSYYRRDEPGVPDHFANRNLPAYYDAPTYLPVTESDRTLDPVLWNGFRFSHRDFEYLDSDPGINRVQTNGGYELYLVDG